MNKNLLFLSIVSLLFLSNSCKNQTKNEYGVYANDFESNNLSGISNGVISSYNNSNVLGQYNNGSFNLKVDNLPNHSLITLKFDLYIHDSWDGNKLAPDGPDIWSMMVDGNVYINASFSNDECNSAPGIFCLPQSYPINYPNNYNNSKSGSFREDLPGVCHFLGRQNGTTQYKIEKTFKHSDNTLLLQCLDKLVQPNSPDPKCDESWSVDNIVIKAIAL